MTDAYIYTTPTDDADVFAVAADALTVARLYRPEPDEMWRLESVAPLTFGTVEFDGDLEPDDAQAQAVDWLTIHQADELDELLS